MNQCSKVVWVFLNFVVHICLVPIWLTGSLCLVYITMLDVGCWLHEVSLALLLRVRWTWVDEGEPSE